MRDQTRKPVDQHLVNTQVKLTSDIFEQDALYAKAGESVTVLQAWSDGKLVVYAPFGLILEIDKSKTDLMTPYQTRLEELDKEIADSHIKVKEANARLIDFLRNTEIKCPSMTCGTVTRVRDLTLVQCYRWDRSDDDWSFVEGKTKCPQCGCVKELRGHPALSKFSSHMFKDTVDEYLR